MFALAFSATTPLFADETKSTEVAGKSAPVTQLKITDQQSGSGATAENGKYAVVQYTGWLYDPAAKDMKGKKVDSSRDRNDHSALRLARAK